MKARPRLTHPDRLLFPGITKEAVAAYYESVAEHMLPFLKDRPLVMQRFPEGIEGPSFYQKNAAEYFPDWIQQVKVPKHGGSVRHVLCNDLDTLIYLVNQACITFHIWPSRTDRLLYPDLMIFDLDPQNEDDPASVRRGTLQLRDLLRELGLVSFVQTSGSRGYHLYVPLERSRDFESVGDFALRVANLLVAREPDRYTTEFHKAKRGTRIFIDTLRNAYAQTAVAPYSLRPKPGAPAATPLEWEELEREQVDPTDFNLSNMAQRLQLKGAAWQKLFGKPQTLDPGALEALAPQR
jgi:bifunctional non-homologous end joining protein LigD